jgi:hypothetical protein
MKVSQSNKTSILALSLTSRPVKRLLSAWFAKLQISEKGPRGEQGPRGEAGPAGGIASAQAYVEDAIHYRGDVVVHLGGTYQAKCDTAKAPPHADWACIAAAGRDARMPKVCGTYREGETYKYLDVVALNGGSFVARYTRLHRPGDLGENLTTLGLRRTNTRPGRDGKDVALTPAFRSRSGPSAVDVYDPSADVRLR